MTARVLVRVVLVVVSCVVLYGIRAPLEEHAHPPHVAPTVAWVAQDYPDFLSAQTAAQDQWIAEQERLERERAEQERRATDERMARPVQAAGVGVVGSGDCARIAQEFGVPVSVVVNESRCTYDAYNAGGCNGRGCVGPVQLDLGHFAAVSPWNPNVPGVCYGLDPYTIEGQRACASRLPASAW